MGLFRSLPHRMKTAMPHEVELFRNFDSLAKKRAAVRARRAVPLPATSGPGRARPLDFSSRKGVKR